MDTAKRLHAMRVECRNVLAMIPPGKPNPFESTAIRVLRIIEKELYEVSKELEPLLPDREDTEH